MAGKTVEESRQAQLAYYDVQCKEKDATKKTSQVTIILTRGLAFTIESDSETIAAYISVQGGKDPLSTKTEFAGLASDFILASCIEEIESMEFDSLIAVEKECNYINHIKEESYLSNMPTVLLDTTPFYLDSGVTVHISPDRSNFITLSSIPDQMICSVGGSTIAATGIGSICLDIRGETYIIIDNALYIPNSTVRLLSISKLAKFSGISTMFNDTGVTLIDKTMKAIIATRTLIPRKDLYVLNNHQDHALSIHASPDIRTWHN